MTRWIMKARRMVAQPPSAGQVEAERRLWGRHPDPVIAQIEEDFFLYGSQGLGLVYRSITAETRPFKKAEGGWGELARMFSAPAEDPGRLVASWRDLVDYLTAKILPPADQAAAVNLWALRSHLYQKVGSSVLELGAADMEREVRTWSPRGRQAVEWTRARGAEYLTDALEATKADVRRTLLACRMAGETTGRLKQKLFERFSDQNRDWRRVAITETAFAVNNSKLATVDPAEGWMAEWRAAANACPFCKAQHGRRFRVVDPDKPDKDGAREIWVGKNNIGRSAHRWSRKEQRARVAAEMWWPALPAHPNCACGLVLVRIARAA